MVLLLRALARLVGLLLLLVLALVGLAAAVFSIQGGDGTLSLAGLVELIRLDDLSDEIGKFLSAMEADGPAAVVAALSGAGAVLLGLALLTGALAVRRERLLIVRRGEDGTVAARRRAVAQTASALAEQPRDVVSAKAKVRPRRRGTGGRLRLTAYHARTANEPAVKEAARAQVESLAGPFSLRTKVDGRVPRRGGRVR